MKIAHIAPPWLPIPPENYGGTENVIAHLVEEQVAQGHEVTLFAPEDARTSANQISFFPQSLCKEHVPWDAHLKAYYHFHKSIAYLKKHREDFDIVHTHLSSSADMYVFPLAEHLMLPQITTLHSQFPFDRTANGWVGEADKYYMEWLARAPLVAISESARRQELKKALPLNIVAVVHHGIPMNDISAQKTRPENFFLWLGRIVPDKGTHLAIEAAKKAGVPLILAGIVDKHVGEAKRYFQEKVEPHLDGKQIRYIGPVGGKAKLDLLSKARALLNPLQWEEPFGMVMVEAMATGCPVISFRRGASPEIIRPGVSGFLVNNVEEMVTSIEQIETLGRHEVQKYAYEHFSAQVMAENYTRVYRQIIGLRQNLRMPVLSKETQSSLRAISTQELMRENTGSLKHS